MKKCDWEVFLVAYQLPVFGADGLFNKEVKKMLVSTTGGIEDAKAACLKYHSGCRIVTVLSGTSKYGDIGDEIIKESADKLGGYK